MEDDQLSVREYAIRALGAIDGICVIPGLVKVIEDDDENGDLRENAVKILGRIGSESAVPGLLSALQARTSHIPWSAAQILEKIGTPDLLSHLWQISFSCKNSRGSPSGCVIDIIAAIQNRCKYYNYEIAQGFIPPGETISPDCLTQVAEK